MWIHLHVEPENQTKKQKEKQPTDAEDKQMAARGWGVGAVGKKKKKGDCEAMNANPLDCGDHFKWYIYMNPSHVYMIIYNFLSIIPQQNWKKILNIKFLKGQSLGRDEMCGGFCRWGFT